MTKEELTAKIIEFAAVAYGKDVASITADTTFEELGGESMKMIALTSTIENELDAEVTIHEIMRMKTLSELIDRVEEEL